MGEIGKGPDWRHKSQPLREVPAQLEDDDAVYLRRWGYGIEQLLKEDCAEWDEHVWTVFRPDNFALDALQLFGAKYPLGIQPIHDELAQADEAHAEYAEKQTEDNYRVLAIVLQRLAERISAAVRAVSEADASHAEPQEPAKAKGGAKLKRGRRKKYDAEADAKLAADWQAAERAGGYKPEFARAKGISVDDLDKALGRVRYRRRAK